MKFGTWAAPLFLLGGLWLVGCVAPGVDSFTCADIPEVTPYPDPHAKYGTSDGGMFAELRVDREAEICMTLNGSDPQRGRTGTYCLPAPIRKIPIYTSTCIRYQVTNHCGTQGQVQRVCWELEPPPQVACEPEPLATNSDLEVTLTSDKSNTTILYTTDGADPDPDDSATERGKAPLILDLTFSSTVKFRGIDDAGNVGSMRTCAYQIDKIPPTTSASPSPGQFSSGPVKVVLTADEAATVYYTVDGSEPSPDRADPIGSTQYGFLQANATLTRSSFVRWYAIDTVGNEESPLHEEVYFIGGKPAVGVEPGGGFFTETSIAVALRARAVNPVHSVEIWYTTDNSPPTRNGSTSTLYTVPITDFDQEGEYILKYIAIANPGASQIVSEIHEATYFLGLTSPPYYPMLSFNTTAQVDRNASSVSVEVLPHKGTARLRRKGPRYINGKSILPADRLPGTPETGVDPGLKVRLMDLNGSELLLYYTNWYGMRAYAIQNITISSSIAPFTSKCVPEYPWVGPCGAGGLNGFMLAAFPFAVSGQPNLIATWTNGVNRGGFSRWKVTYPSAGAVATEYNQANRQQFMDGDENDPPVADIADPDFVTFPRSAGEIVGTTLYLPRYATGHQIYAYRATDATQLTASPGQLAGRALAIQADHLTATPNNLLAVGDTAGQLSILDRTTLALKTGGNRAIACPGNTRCRINDLEWTADGEYVLLALGYYGSSVTGQVGVAKVDSNGGVQWISGALLTTDDFRISSPVESVRVIPARNIAVIAVRDQGLLYLDLTNLGTGRLTSLGYITGTDFGDANFNPVDIATYHSARPFVGETWFVAADAGRTYTSNDVPQNHAGFRIFETPSLIDLARWETGGTLYSRNLNTRDKRVNRVRLQASDPTVLSGVVITLIGDGTEETAPLVLGNDVIFTTPPLDVRAKIVFSGDGSSSVAVKTLQLKFTPSE